MKKNILKKCFSIVISLTMLLSLFVVSACNGSDDSTDIIILKDTTIYAYIESIEDKNIVLSFGSLMEMAGGNQDGENLQDIPGGSSTDGTTPPDKPDSSEEEGTNPPEIPDGEESQGEDDSKLVIEEGGEEQGGSVITPDMPNEDNQGDIVLNTSYFYKSSTQATIIITDENLIYDADNNVIGLSGLQTGNIIEIDIDGNSIISKIQVLNATLYEFNGDNPGGQGQQGGDQGQGQQDSSVTYTAIYTYTSDDTVENVAINSTGKDEEAILVKDGAKVTFNNITLTRVSSDSTGGDNSSFYGVGAGLLVMEGTAYVSGGSFTTDSKGGAGAFSYDKGVVYIAGATIQTTQSTSGGIHVAGGGTLYAWDLTVTTSGESSAAIRSDRGGGTMVVDGGSYTTNGTGSPSIYCTADIAVNNATLTANNSEAICIEGLNSLYIYNSQITSNMPDNEQNDTTWSIIVYQSMSGDSEIGNGTLSIIDSTIDCKNGGVFYTTNTECSILLENTTITTYTDTEFFLQCTGNTNSRGWGSVGSNGSDCLFTARNQVMKGDVIWDKASCLDLYILEGSSLTGGIYNDDTYAGSATSGYSSIYIDSESQWVVTRDCTVTNLYNAGSIVDGDGKTVTIVDNNGSVLVQGTSSYTIKVLNNYSTSVDTTNALVSTTFQNFAVAKPSELED